MSVASACDVPRCDGAFSGAGFGRVRWLHVRLHGEQGSAPIAMWRAGCANDLPPDCAKCDDHQQHNRGIACEATKGAWPLLG